jgi:pimeloyl-ACP methyl ester carboxylesterase
LKLERFYSLAASSAPRELKYRGAVVSVHGMNTRGVWQNELGPELQDAVLYYEMADYGDVKIGALSRGTVVRIAEEIRKHYGFLIAKNAPLVSAVGHSLGTLGITKALLSTPDMRFDRIILAGSILPVSFQWQQLVATQQVGGVLNETTDSDPWPKRAKYVIPNSGRSGCDGFGDGCGGIVRRRHYADTDHSLLLTRLHFRTVWVPYLLGEPVENLPPRGAVTT